MNHNIYKEDREHLAILGQRLSLPHSHSSLSVTSSSPSLLFDGHGSAASSNTTTPLPSPIADDKPMFFAGLKFTCDSAPSHNSPAITEESYMVLPVAAIICPTPPIPGANRPLEKAHYKAEVSLHSRIRRIYNMALYYEDIYNNMVERDILPPKHVADTLEWKKREIWNHHYDEMYPHAPWPISPLKPAGPESTLLKAIRAAVNMLFNAGLIRFGAILILALALVYWIYIGVSVLHLVGERSDYFATGALTS